jgi:hypothetical protein
MGRLRKSRPENFRCQMSDARGGAHKMRTTNNPPRHAPQAYWPQVRP